MKLHEPFPIAADAYEVVNDGVMGGVSSSRLRDVDGALRFAGEVRLENNGGFASMRSNPLVRDCSKAGGITLTVVGDGRTYKLNLRDRGRTDGVFYRVAFDTVAGETVTKRFPFSAFRAAFRGRAVPDAPPLDTSAITQIGLLIADGVAGAFSIDVVAIAPYSG